MTPGAILTLGAMEGSSETSACRFRFELGVEFEFDSRFGLGLGSVADVFARAGLAAPKLCAANSNDATARMKC